MRRVFSRQAGNPRGRKSIPALVLLTMIAGASALAYSAVALAASPPGCSVNAPQLAIGALPVSGFQQPHGTVTFQVFVSNNAPNACDITTATVTFTPPDPVTGLATGAPVNLPVPGGTISAGTPSTQVGTDQTFTVPTGGYTSGAANASAALSGTAQTPTPHAATATASNSVGDVDANISISPLSATNTVGATHTLTLTVNSLGGTIDPGTHTITASINSGPGSPASLPCTYTAIAGDTSGHCNVTFSESTVGANAISATSDVPVNGVTITRTTNTADNTAAGGSGNATKNWVNANISISPLSATNTVGATHTLTLTVNSLGGTIDPGTHTITASINSGPGSPASLPCTYTAIAGDTSGHCNVTFSESTVGANAISATSDIPVDAGGNPAHTVTRTTNTTDNTNAGGGGNAAKNWVDANISISPLKATNTVGATHTLTLTVNSLGGTIDPGTHTITASINSGPGSPASLPCTYTAIAGDTSGHCNVTFSESTVGANAISATSDIPVDAGGNPAHTVTRTTNTTDNTNAGGGGNAAKNWVDANISISPLKATNPVNATHTLTITVNALGGTIDPGTHTITASVTSGPGSPATLPCTYTAIAGDTSGHCSVSFTSSSAGLSTISATSAIPVDAGGNPTDTITKTTGTAGNTTSGGSGNAQKMWIDTTVESSTGTPTTTFAAPASVKDVFTGATAAAGDTVTFTLLQGNCATGSVVATDANVTILADGTATSGTHALNPSVTTNYSFSVTYNGPTFPSQTANCEPFQVTALLPPTIVTVSNPTGGSVTPGTSVTDTATVSGTGVTPTGTVTFTLCQPATVTTNGGDCSAGGATVGAVKTLSAGGTATSDATTNTTTVGTYCWRVDYSGDSHYTAGSHTNSTTECFTVVQQLFAGCTPGFWKNHESLWDSLSDPAVSAMPAGLRFTTNTLFNTYFNLTPAQSSFSNTTTMHDAVSAGGGGPKALARQAVSALLSIGAGLNYQFPPGATDFTSLYNLIRSAYLSGTFEPLQTQLAAANNLEFNCSSLLNKNK